MNEELIKIRQLIQAFDPGLYRIESRITRVTFKSGQGNTGEKILLGPNQNRIGFLVYNESSNIILIAFDNKPAVAKRYSDQIGSNTSYPYFPEKHIYKGQVTYNPKVAGDGALQVTEFVRVKQRTREE